MKKILFDKENESRPYIAVNAVIITSINNSKHILLSKRKNVAGAGNWYVPGGHIHMDEAYKTALKREVREECGLDIVVGNPIWLEENFENNLHHITIYCETTLLDSNQKVINMEPHKCEEWKWFPINNPPEPLWVSLGTFLEKYQKNEIMFLK